LAARQAELVSALTGAGPAPASFDADRVAAAAEALGRKRARAAARAWPTLAAALGDRFAELFADYARTAPLPRRGGPLADGRAFVRRLTAASRLPDEARLQVLAVDLEYAGSADGLVPRRGPAIQAAWLRGSRRLILGVRLPWLGIYWCRSPSFTCR
jgi:hypothetical protein